MYEVVKTTTIGLALIAAAGMLATSYITILIVKERKQLLIKTGGKI